MGSCQIDVPLQDNIFNNVTGIQISQLVPQSSVVSATLQGLSFTILNSQSSHHEKWSPISSTANIAVVDVMVNVMYMKLSDHDEIVPITVLVNLALQQWDHNDDYTHWWTHGPLTPPIEYVPSANLPGNLGPVVYTANISIDASFGQVNVAHPIDPHFHYGTLFGYTFNRASNGYHYQTNFRFVGSLNNPPASSYATTKNITVPNITKWRLLSPRAQREWISDTSGMQQVSSASVIQGTSGRCETNILELRIWACLPVPSLPESFHVLVRLETSEGLLLGTFTDIDNVPLCANTTNATGSNVSLTNAMLMTTPSLASTLIYPNEKLSPKFKAYSVAFQALTYAKQTDDSATESATANTAATTTNTATTTSTTTTSTTTITTTTTSTTTTTITTTTTPTDATNSLGSETATTPIVEGMTVFRTSLTLPSTNTIAGCPTIVSDQLAYLDFTTDYPFSSAVNFYAPPPRRCQQHSNVTANGHPDVIPDTPI
jgi:hypothetical protein